MEKYTTEKYTTEKLAEILEKHSEWLRSHGERGERAAFSGVNLRGIDLRGIDLRGVDLRGANLNGIDLSGVNLNGVDLRFAVGNMSQVKSIFICTYPIIYTSEIMHIGWEGHTFEEWWSFTDERIDRMHEGGLLKWWHLNKDFIRSTVERFPATATNYKESSHVSDDTQSIDT